MRTTPWPCHSSLGLSQGSPRALPDLRGLSETYPESAENHVAEKYRESHPKPPKMEVKSKQKSMKFELRLGSEEVLGKTYEKQQKIHFFSDSQHA